VARSPHSCTKSEDYLALEARWMTYLAIAQLGVVTLFSIWRLTVNLPAIGLAEKDRLSAKYSMGKPSVKLNHPKMMIRPLPNAQKLGGKPRHNKNMASMTPYGTIKSHNFAGSVASGRTQQIEGHTFGRSK
jgi:hypothetical protein